MHVESCGTGTDFGTGVNIRKAVLDVKDATCYVTGYTGDTYCSVCNIKLAEGTVTPKLEHKYEDNVCKTVEELIMPS